MNMEIGRQNIIILFWKKQGRTVSFLGTHQSEPYIYIRFSSTLPLQCVLEVYNSFRNFSGPMFWLKSLHPRKRVWYFR
jgi:hypothetical protein